MPAATPLVGPLKASTPTSGREVAKWTDLRGTARHATRSAWSGRPTCGQPATRPSGSRNHRRVRPPPPALDRLARQQSGVVSRAQLATFGVDRAMVSRRARDRVWHPLGPRVVVLHRGVLTTEQRWWVGVLHAAVPAESAGPAPAVRDVALTRLTAAEAGGLVGFATDTVHVAVEHGREVDDLDHPAVRIRVHQTRHLEPDQLHPARRPPRIRLARAVVESASEVAVSRPGRARALIAAAVQQRLVRPAELRPLAASRRTLPGRQLLIETIGDAAGGAHSLPELAYLRGLRAAGLPAPTRQRKVQRPDGAWYLDNDFADHLVSVEVNGLQHYELLLQEADDFQRAVLQISGRIVIDLTSYAVRHHIQACVLLTAEALLAHGWHPAPKVERVLAAYREQLGRALTTLIAS